MTLAGMTKTPEFMLDKTEARALAEASANVARHYDLGATQKTLDFVALFTTVGMVYGTRMMAISARKKKDRAKTMQENGDAQTAPVLSLVPNA